YKNCAFVHLVYSFLHPPIELTILEQLNSKQCIKLKYNA
ncbi:hypothetical protein DBR06_SOUSAS8210065, partial [Sousa chinensis]